ncbi:MAG TPA: hypothetical protein VK657_04060 [Terriglobales bacterium]|nr:hypothetical protein [Terriglobales bacterium]
MSAAGELLHVRATLGQHRGGGLGANAGDGLQELVGLAQIRVRDAAGDFLIQRFNLVGQKGHVPHGARDQKWMRIPHRMAFQGRREFGILFPGMPPC